MHASNPKSDFTAHHSTETQSALVDLNSPNLYEVAKEIRRGYKFGDNVHRIVIDGEIACVQLTLGLLAIIDRADVELVKSHLWRAQIDKDGRVYAYSGDGESKPCIAMHRIIVGAEPRQIVDHRNGYGLDNRRENLRLCTNAENIRNSRKYAASSTSHFKGVTKRPNGTFRAQIMAHGKKKNLGNYPTEELAARAYDAAAIERFGEFARLNFPTGGAA